MALQTPSPTLYVSNLEAKTKKPELRAQLYALFNPYGHILDIVAKKNGGMRGQAFVVFEEQTAATAAMRGVTGKTFYGKLLSITYAKKPSNATLARSDPSASREAAAIQAAKLTVSRAQNEYEQLEKEREETDTAAMGGNAKRDLEDAEGGEPGAKRVKKEQGDDDEMEIEMDEEDDDAPAGTSLICTNLPPECSEEIMGALFSQHTGFSKATLLPSSTTLPSSLPSPNPGAKAFRVTFSSASQAKAAVEATSGFLMQPGWSMGVAVE